jgi:hypothetical protein
MVCADMQPHLLPCSLYPSRPLLHPGSIVSVVDERHFSGLEAVPDAIDHLYAGGNVGKVVVSVNEEVRAKL